LSDYNYAFSLYQHWVKDTIEKNCGLNRYLRGNLTTMISDIKHVCEGGMTQAELFTQRMEESIEPTPYNTWRLFK